MALGADRRLNVEARILSLRVAGALGLPLAASDRVRQSEGVTQAGAVLRGGALPLSVTPAAAARRPPEASPGGLRRLRHTEPPP